MKGSTILLLIELGLALLCIPLFRGINETIKRREEKTAKLREKRIAQTSNLDGQESSDQRLS